MLNANAGNSGKTQLFGGLDANHPIQDGIAAPDQHGIAKTELGDRGCDFTNLSRFLTPHVARRADEIGQREFFNPQGRQKIVTPPQGRSGGQ